MSKGFGHQEIQIIKYIEKKRYFISRQIIRHIAGGKPPPSQRSSIYASIKRLRKDGVIVPSDIRKLYELKHYEEPNNYMINEKNPKYLKWKNP